MLLSRQGQAGVWRGDAECAAKSQAGSTATVFWVSCGSQAFPGSAPSQESSGCAFTAVQGNDGGSAKWGLFHFDF